MRKIFLGIIVLTFVACVPTKQEMKKEFDVSSGKLLNINLKSGGSLDIQGWKKEKALVDVGFRNCDPEDFDFDIIENIAGISVKSDYRHRVRNSSMMVIIKIPQKFNIKLKTAGGSVSIQNVEGEINGSSGGGSLKFSHLTGEINFSTGGGSVKIKDSELDGRVSTGGGKVLVENVVGDIKASSGGGNVVYSAERTGK